MSITTSARSELADLTDEKLVALIADGEARAFDVIFERYYPQIFNFARKQMSSPENIEDVVQEVFLRVFKSAGNFDTERKFSSWLYRIALNEIKRSWKRSQSRQAWSLNTPLGDEHGDAERQDYLPDNRPAAAELAESDLFSRDLRKLIDRLPEKQKTVVLLKVYQGLTFEQIAEICECPLSTVLSRMRYAVSKLRRWLGLDDEGNDNGL
jgi:RNA polymerase sigma-70 factor (ECF subfamily)